MEEILKIASKVSDQAEVFFMEHRGTGLSFEDGKPSDVEGAIQTGYALRIIKDGKIGSSYTRNLIDREELVKNALASMVGEVKADFAFPEKRPITNINQYDKKTEDVGFPELMDMSNEMLGFFEGKVKGQTNCYSGAIINRRRIMNTNGADYEEKSTKFYLIPALVFPNTTTSIWRYFESNGPGRPTKKDLQKQLELYTCSLPEVNIGSKKTKVMFMPPAFTGFEWRLNAGAQAKRFLNKTSPLTDKVGQKIMSEKMTIYNDPLDQSVSDACGFDDEGVPTRRLDIVKNGIFQTCFADLDYANKMKMEPTGTGFRHEMWGQDDVTIPPTPYLKHLRIQPGDYKFEEMLAEMDEGVAVLNVIGAHSGNILNGDFSFGLNPGFYVKRGEIIGRIKDAMVAGNMYQLFSNVIGIENQNHEKNSIPLPCILFDNVSISGK
jgi:PmbA protein